MMNFYEKRFVSDLCSFCEMASNRICYAAGYCAVNGRVRHTETREIAQQISAVSVSGFASNTQNTFFNRSIHEIISRCAETSFLLKILSFLLGITKQRKRVNGTKEEKQQQRRVCSPPFCRRKKGS